MLTFIMEEPDADAGKDRGHTMPFHSDMIFQMNKTVINDFFFCNDEEALTGEGKSQGRD